MKIETKCLHEGYTPKNGEPQAMPIYQSTTYNYQSTEHIGQLFDLAAEGHMYSRISNPTVEMVEKKIAALEGGVRAIWNFAPVDLVLPEGVAVNNVHLSDSLHILSYRMNEKELFAAIDAGKQQRD